jgi:hypothetical protein
MAIPQFFRVRELESWRVRDIVLRQSRNKLIITKIANAIFDIISNSARRARETL